jgi:hypothetical protein
MEDVKCRWMGNLLYFERDGGEGTYDKPSIPTGKDSHSSAVSHSVVDIPVTPHNLEEQLISPSGRSRPFPSSSPSPPFYRDRLDKLINPTRQDMERYCIVSINRFIIPSLPHRPYAPQDAAACRG